MKYYLSRDISITYFPKFREYGINVTDGGSSYVLIDYCPWCGKKLEKSLRKVWLSEIRKMGFEPGDDRIPKDYLSDKWWKKAQKNSK